MLERLAASMKLAPIVYFAVRDRLSKQPAGSAGGMPVNIDHITPEWLTSVMCRQHPGACVTGFQRTWSSKGTNHRERLHLHYNAIGCQLDLPATVFTKSTPGVANRVAAAITNGIEAHFYRDLRPRLSIEAPTAYFAGADTKRMAVLLLLEDLEATKMATFCGPQTLVTREMASQIVCTLAAVHATFRGPKPTNIKTYQQTWADASALSNLKRYYLKAFDEGIEHIDPAIGADPRRAWRAFLASVELHDCRTQGTLLHNDVHIGNWYRTGDTGKMGLTDWQAVAYGHWSRDLAYAVSTALTPEHRRAWEADLISEYIEEFQRLSKGGAKIDHTAAVRAYRAELWGALAMWTPTYSPPRVMPEMQPRAVSAEMLRRITTACADNDSLAAVGV